MKSEGKIMDEVRVVVSMTSYPARIGCVFEVVQSLLAQTRKADLIVLYLAGEQFPGGSSDLPEKLNMLEREKSLVIRWCDDLKPHKKYYYALQEYSDCAVITVDDDVIYPPDLISSLCESYERHPGAVSAGRTHLIMLSEDNKVMPYRYWPKEVNMCLDKPSLQLLATGVAGILYPPHVFGAEAFDREAIEKTSLLADDLWLKAMELVYDVPVVTARKSGYLRLVDGSQDVALYHKNVDSENNDIQLASIISWLDKKHGEGFFVNRILESDPGQRYTDRMSISRCLADELNAAKRDVQILSCRLEGLGEKYRLTNEKLQKTYKEKSEINCRLQQTYKEKSERGEKIKELEKRLCDYENSRMGRLQKKLWSISGKLRRRG